MTPYGLRFSTSWTSLLSKGSGLMSISHLCAVIILTSSCPPRDVHNSRRIRFINLVLLVSFSFLSFFFASCWFLIVCVIGEFTRVTSQHTMIIKWRRPSCVVERRLKLCKYGGPRTTAGRRWTRWSLPIRRHTK
jgi:hypothetical protein